MKKYSVLYIACMFHTLAMGGHTDQKWETVATYHIGPTEDFEHYYFKYITRSAGETLQAYGISRQGCCQKTRLELFAGEHPQGFERILGREHWETRDGQWRVYVTSVSGCSEVKTIVSQRRMNMDMPAEKKYLPVSAAQSKKFELFPYVYKVVTAWCTQK